MRTSASGCSVSNRRVKGKWQKKSARYWALNHHAIFSRACAAYSGARRCPKSGNNTTSVPHRVHSSRTPCISGFPSRTSRTSRARVVPKHATMVLLQPGTQQVRIMDSYSKFGYALKYQYSMIFCAGGCSVKNIFCRRRSKKFLDPARATLPAGRVPRARLLVPPSAKTVIAKRHALGSTVLVPEEGLEPSSHVGMRF